MREAPINFLFITQSSHPLFNNNDINNIDCNYDCSIVHRIDCFFRLAQI